jgi:protein-S-isoprenylcysteine O-methyltransferase Ste14
MLVARRNPSELLAAPATAPALLGTRMISSDLLSRAAVGVLFTFLSVNVLQDFIQTGRVTGLLLLLSECLVVVLTVVRRPAQLVDRSLWAGMVTAISLVGPPLLWPSSGDGLVPDLVTASASALGLVLVVVGKLTLGRSFGLVPANRGVVVRGPYSLVRHPIYSGYLITHLAFLIAHPHWWNVIVVLTADTALVARALVEERVLGRDAEYRAYCQRVSWHLVPGVF